MKITAVSIADPTAALTAPGVKRAGRTAAAQSDEPAPVGRAPQARPEELEAARQAANRALAQKGSELAFEFDDELGRVIAKLIDKQTREVVRQLPSEAVLAIARALAEGAHAGTVVHTNA
jgi:flagellar protein FlaG